MFCTKNTCNIPKVVWFYIPWLVLAALISTYLLSPELYKSYLHGESGGVETLQSIILVMAFACSLRNLLTTARAKSYWVMTWVWVACLGVLYAFLEEICYGQHIFGFENSELLESISNHNGNNLDNASSRLDQKIRLSLEAALIIGGIIIPLLSEYAPKLLPDKFKIIYPSMNLLSVAVIAESIHLVDILLPDAHIFGRAGEVQELYYYYFILLYLVMLRLKVVDLIDSKKT